MNNRNHTNNRKTVLRGMLALVLAFMVLFGGIPFASAQEAASGAGNGVRWTFDEDGTLTFSPDPKAVDGREWRHSFYYGYAEAKSIEVDAYYDDMYREEIYGSVRKIVLREGITAVPQHALVGFPNVTEAVLPETLQTIGPEAFYLCGALERVSLPGSLETIGEDAFAECTSLAEIAIPDSVKTIGEGAFSGCSSLRKVTLPAALTSINRHVFRYCGNLAEINIPVTVTSIGDDAFYGCGSLTSAVYAGTAEQFRQIDIKFDNGSLLWGCHYTTAGSCLHAHTEWREPVRPSSCQEDGVTGGEFCSDCGRYISGALPMKGRHTDADRNGKCDVCGERACDLYFKQPVNLYFSEGETVRLELTYDRVAYYDIITTGNYAADLKLYDADLNELDSSEHYIDNTIHFVFEKDRIYYLDVTPRDPGQSLFQLNLWEGALYSNPGFEQTLYYGDKEAFTYHTDENGKVVSVAPSGYGMWITSASNSRCVDGAGHGPLGEEGARFFDFHVGDAPDQNGELAVGKHMLKLTSCYGEEFDVPFEITESPVEKIEFIPVKEYVLEEGCDGEMTTDSNGTAYFEYRIRHHAGDRIVVTYKNGEVETLTCSKDDGYPSFRDENGWRVYFSDYSGYSAKTDQAVNHWTVGNEYRFYTKFMGVTTSTPVRIGPKRGFGDVDGDGSIDPGDARLALRASVDLEYLNDNAFLAADSDGDGVITPSDARTILRIAVKLETLENWIPSQGRKIDESDAKAKPWG